jgi:hypothetical protein
MIELGLATEDQMILAFLQGEVDSSRFSPCVNQVLAALGRDRALIDAPDLGDASESHARRCILYTCRGYPSGYLFVGWPQDAVWRQVSLERADFDTMKYANNVESLLILSGGSRLARDGAANYSRGVADTNVWSHLDAILAGLRRGETYAPLIAAQSVDDSSLVLVEGHSRATAYLIEATTADVKAFVAASPSMANWQYY